MKPVNIGILGLGTVGSGIVRVLQDNALEISRRLGHSINIAAVCDTNEQKARSICPDAEFIKNPFELVQRNGIDVVVELFGGTDTAKAAILKAIENNKHIVTANKKLLAEYGNDIFSLAGQKNVMVQFEAAVAGGIPIIKTLRESLVAGNIQSIAGIINGTSNFILTEMRENGSDFAQALKKAQQLGYAEADPTFDIEGYDAGHKITITSALSFGIPINFNACYLEGINKLNNRDIKYAEELGYRIKLLGITRKSTNGIELRVHPTLIPERHLLANVNGVMNAVYVDAGIVGKSLYYGAGAGALPTAGAVVADIVDVCRLMNANPADRVPYLAFQACQIKTLPILAIDEINSSYYLRVQVEDKPDRLGKIAGLLSSADISIKALIQKDVTDTGIAEIVILTHNTIERNIKTAIAAIKLLDEVNTVTMIRMEHLHGCEQ